MRRAVLLLLLAGLVVCLCACGPKKTTSDKPSDNPNTSINEGVVPQKGQPPFPPIGNYWVIDVDNACGFSLEATKAASGVFQKLQDDKIAEVVVICIKGVKDFGPLNDEKIWSMDWGNWSRLGIEKRGLIWLIRPDVPPEQDRVTVQNADWLYQLTVMDYFPGLEEAANYANWGDYDGALESLARNSDETLRRVVKP